MRDPVLTLQKAVDACRAAETSKAQMKNLGETCLEKRESWSEEAVWPVASVATIMLTVPGVQSWERLAMSVEVSNTSEKSASQT